MLSRSMMWQSLEGEVTVPRHHDGVHLSVGDGGVVGGVVGKFHSPNLMSAFLFQDIPTLRLHVSGMVKI